MSTHAPYNFVPFAEHPLRRYDSPAELPSHSTWDPELLSGEIQLTITAKTPIYVGNGEKNEKADFFRTADGKYTIPGSTLRGLVRENMQMLGIGLLRKDEDFQNYHILFRRMADMAGSGGEDLKLRFQTILGIENNKPPQNVKGGYLYCSQQGEYFIQPVEQVFLAPKDLDENSQWKDLVSEDRPIWYKQQGTSKKGEPTVILSETGGDEWREGTLHCVGWMKNGKDPKKDQKTLYVFPEPDENAEEIKLTESEIVAYREDFEARKNTLSGTKRNMKPEFWALPEKEQRKPVFYIQRGSFTSFGMSRYLRVAYERAIEEGLPEGHRELANQLFLDYPYSILGYAERESSFCSRVSFSDLPTDGIVSSPELLQTKLGEPKISFFLGYSVDSKHYDEENFRFRGYKQYWLKDVAKQLEPVQPDQTIPSFCSTMRPLPVGTRFSGSIRYHNLHEDELGLLLWCIVLDKECQQNIGGGKPYGYGRIDIQVNALTEFAPDHLYDSRNLSSWPASLQGKELRDRIEALIKCYTESSPIQLLCKKGIREYPPVRDFLGMKRSIVPGDCQKYNYMPIASFRNLKDGLETARQMLNELKKNSTPALSSSGQPVKIGDIVECAVVEIKPTGVSVQLGSGETGMIMSKEISTPINKLKKGSLLKAKVVSNRFGLMLTCKGIK